MSKNHLEHQSLHQKVVVITGASSGVGLATAEAFAKRGCQLVLASRGEEALAKAVAYCKMLGAHVLGVPTDVSDYDQVKSLTAQALSLTGKIDFWVNNAGVMASGRFEEIPMEVNEQVIKTNLFGYLHGAYAILPIFKQQGHGVLINNVSIGGYMPAPYSAVYSATKGGIKLMMECLQGEISNERDIHISNLYPQIQRSTGNMHSAKYSGLDFKVPPTAADPRDTAAHLLNLAVNPKKDQFPDFSSWALKTMHSLFPKILVNTASAGMRFIMELKNAPSKAGNVLKPSEMPHQIYGETMLPVVPAKAKLTIVASIGLGIAYLLISGRKN